MVVAAYTVLFRLGVVRNRTPPTTVAIVERVNLLEPDMRKSD